MLKEVTKNMKNVEVISFSGLLVDFAKEHDVNIIVRGLRAVTDFEYELLMSQTNRVMDSSIDTIFLTTDLQYAYLSSSTVKEIAMYGGDIDMFVPRNIEKKIRDKFSKRDS